MLTTFTDHLRLHAGLDEDRIDRLSAAMEHVRLEMGRSLLAPGEPWTSHAFVCHGCLRVFFTEEDGSQRVLSAACLVGGSDPATWRTSQRRAASIRRAQCG